MEAKNAYKRNYQIFGIIACVGLIFSSISIIKAFNESKIYEALDSNTPIVTTSNLGEELLKAKNTSETNALIQQQEYEKALQSISGNQGQDYYNRGTIQSLIAYTYALQSDISGLESAQMFVAQAQQSFSIAKKLSNSQEVKNAIAKNEKTITKVSAVIDIKNCYGLGQGIITSIGDINTSIKEIRETLATEEEYIEKRRNNLDAACYKKLQYIVDTSKEQLGGLDLEMKKNRTKYLSDFLDKIDNPMLCIQAPYENIIPTIVKGMAGLEAYEFQHQNTIEALKSSDIKSIQELCNQSKNDAQINQKIESSVQELLQKLQENTIENNLSSKEGEKQRASKEVKYEEFFNQDEQKILQEIEKTNQGWIKNTLDIRGKGNYTPDRYLNDMFNEFYGSSGDFIDLHK